MWRALFKLFAVLARMGAFAISFVVMALIAVTLVERDWLDGISIYIVVISVISIPASLIPPYPNLILDAFFAIAWVICAVFAFLLMFLKSSCYGVADIKPGQEYKYACSKYQALTAMCFLGVGAWGACAVISGLLILIAVFKNAREKNRHAMILPTQYAAEARTTTTRPANPEPPVEPIPAPVHTYQGDPKIVDDGPFLDPSGGPSFAEARPYSPEKRPYLGEDKLYPEKKGPAWPAAYEDTYHPEEFGESYKTSPAMAAGATPAATETRIVEEKYEVDEPVLYTPDGWGAGFVMRHWLALGFLAVILVAVALPLLFIYAVPAFAVYVVDNIRIPDNFYGEIAGFRSDHAVFNIHTSFKSPAGISATVKPMNLSLFLGDTYDHPIPLAYALTTPIHVHGGKAIVAYNQSLYLGNLTEWTRLWRKFFFQDELSLGVQGDIKLKTGPINLSVKTKKLKSFQGLLNATQLELSMLEIRPPDADGNNFFVSLPVINPSPLTVSTSAEATADLMIAGQTLAHASLDKFSLVKGKGTLNAKAQLDTNLLMTILTNFFTIVGGELPAVGQGYAVATVQATSLVDNGVAYPYWQIGARGIKLAAAVEWIPLIGSLAGDVLGNLFSGAGLESLLTAQPLNQTLAINTTLVNKILNHTKVYDAVELGLVAP